MTSTSLKAITVVNVNNVVTKIWYAQHQVQ